MTIVIDLLEEEYRHHLVMVLWLLQKMLLLFSKCFYLLT